MSGKKIVDKFMVLDIEERDTKSGKSKYFYLTLSDGNTTISAKKWNSNQLNDHDKDKYEEFLQSKGKVVKIIGKKEEYKGKKQIILTDLHILENEDTKKYIPQTKRDSDKMKKEFDAIVESINNKINRDVLIAGILLHDIGKIVEYSNELGNITNTDEGKLVGHIVIGSELVETVFKKITKAKKNDFYRDIADKIVDFRGTELKSKKDRESLFQLLENFFKDITKNDEFDKNMLEKIFDENYKKRFLILLAETGSIKNSSSKKGLFNNNKKLDNKDKFNNFLKKIKKFSYNYFQKVHENYYLKLKIKHIILAHHGQREFGAPIVPKTIEAYIVQ